ncbi:MAG: polyribonucleotide nucleotidyltransferase [Candidatus Brennerbacteria bacterium RIFOXYC1_FULL_41_11]|uniref:Polyribonucleotide nucleotidyltransferase n=1 Tax=Candidatus Brennerbacteria bacterium RIFOXYD1_FULL_41_16 TaxID=1797529 RepID=A0A1G1XKZ0_9BACT|nr:MAG: polynucleotide phosphorylase/polyadenylase [Parcubacteria group bacterium GW2011_GWB1_41_4]OGY39584.1 MAG: polyribonucleotide nucleotidyltransferase [Candidatus Brennerbacteria bacterium RIFOXYB1_FULL_41_13]OGY39888.1 MAG: polyribonucleotide nucleotidyltransferase [Candidatus Brennerbacteria bacterium RIFOXYC1_FULL_41_11]OGY40699.1 MAG: polyribonucleotide nucleotidyltransferase [Candidatus Brennerbacteria bacterium RIFOXYD1_FULL_41_16]
MNKKTFKKEFAGRNLEIEFSPLAENADASCLIRYGETVALITLVASKQDENTDFFPLMIDYEEKFYAAGKIYGSRFIRRETRPTEGAILTGRLVDRTLRPLFDQDTRRKVQIVITVLSIDRENDPDFIALLGASIVSSLSPIPFRGPAAGIRVAKINNEVVLLPTYDERENSSIDSFWGGIKTKINMIEVGAKESQEDEIEEISKISFEKIKELVSWQEEILKNFEVDKINIKKPEVDQEIREFINSTLKSHFEDKYFKETPQEGYKNHDQATDLLKEFLEEKGKLDQLAVAESIVFHLLDELVHESALKHEKRFDGRKLDQVRDIEIFTGVLPRTHGTGMFLRGKTHALSIITLGAPGDSLMQQGMEVNGEKHFIHQYNAPSYSVGETGPNRGPGRREIGHGALAEKAIQPMLPSREEFPYTIRVVTEILSQNGSTSMASVCGTSLALMDAGVPIKKHVAGIAIGLMTGSNGEYKLLTDIQGPEDHHGDMDCKVAGTKDGINAMQMDVKIDGITPEIISEILIRAKKARLEILEKMEASIASPKKDLSPYAPKIAIISIPVEKIGGVIGSGGKTIHAIIEKSGALVEIKDDGTIYITGETKESISIAEALIKGIVKEYEVGEILEGKVSKILDFGAVIELSPNKEGLVHISELAPRRVNTVDEIVKLGQIISVKVIEILPDGKIRLSLKQATNQDNTNTNHGRN